MIVRILVSLVALLLALVQLALFSHLGPLSPLDLFACFVAYQVSFRPLTETLVPVLLAGVTIDSYLDGPWGAVTLSFILALGGVALLQRRIGRGERLLPVLVALVAFKTLTDVALLLLGLFAGGSLREFPAQFQFSLIGLLLTIALAALLYAPLGRLYLLYDLWLPARRRR